MKYHFTFGNDEMEGVFAMDTVKEIIEDSAFGVLATVSGSQPRVRPMAFVLLEDCILWSSTYDISGKVVEFEANDRVEVCFVDSKKRHVRIEGIVDISGGAKQKETLLKLNPKVGKHFSDGHDPKFVHIEIKPIDVRWKNPGFSEYTRVTVG